MPYDAFLKLDQVAGESTSAQHPNECELLAWNWAESHATTAGAAGQRPEIADLTFTKLVDRASPKLLIACARGDILGKGVLTVRRAGGSNFILFRFLLTDVSVRSYQIGGASGDQAATETVSLSFAKIELEYKQQGLDGNLQGTVRAGWDLKLNRPA